MFENIKRFIWRKPDKNYIKWLFSQNKNSLGNGLIFTFITVTALTLVDLFLYSELLKDTAQSIAAGNPPKNFELDNFFRLIIAPIVNITAIFIAKSKWNNSMKRREILAAFVLFINAFSFLLSGIFNEYYNAGDDYSYDLLVLILFSQTLFGLTYRTTLFFNSTLFLTFLIYLIIDDEDTKDAVFALTLVLLVWIPTLSNTFKLERSRLANYHAITDLEKANNQVSKQKSLLKAGEKVSQMASWQSTSDMVKFNYSDGIYAIYELDQTKLKPVEVYEKIIEFIHPEDKNKVFSSIESIRNGDLIPTTEYRIILPNGKIKWLKSTVGDYVVGEGYYGTIQDITKEKLIEIELQNQAAELKLKNEELQQFAYASSHDLQEPLRSITNFVGLLNKKLGSQLKPEHKMFMDIIINSAGRMKQLIHAILDYSRIGRNKTLQTFDCNQIVTNVMTDLHFSIDKAKARIYVDNLPEITAYKTEFSLLLQNLIGNSLKFKKEGVQPVIKIRGIEVKDEFQFCVEDNGIGINQKYANKIFQLFSRLHTSEEYEGTGIGLTHCKKIVELHGGKIWIESTLNKGTIFYFTIPKIILNLTKNGTAQKSKLHLVN